MSKTKLDLNDKHHQLLIATLSAFINDFGYSPREMYELLENTRRQTFNTFMEMHREAENK
ncbi:hypothetical protein C7437_1011051 [Psychrobacillus insolitus]|uniref:Uncharacterized protein n=1 Tax=Psychrobacillus insolitus TaxID=1461 RepID=A0A2W7NBU6_9BACI|nr:hypothetical protein C7437_1011051 [Psychrobacillus insolitus]